MHIIPMAKDGHLVIVVLGGDADLPLSGSGNITYYVILQPTCDPTLDSNLLLQDRVR